MSLILVGHGSIGSRYKASLLKRGINKNDIKIKRVKLTKYFFKVIYLAKLFNLFQFLPNPRHP